MGPSQKPPQKLFGKYPTSVVRGAASELLASAHLMSLGYHVFRALAANCPFDLFAYKDGETLRVEVKSSTYRPDDRYNPSFPKPRNDEWDILAIVTHCGTVSLIPFSPDFDAIKDAYFEALAEVGIERKFFGRPTIRKIRATEGAGDGV